MKFAVKIILLTLSVSLFSGCRALQSEMQKSQLASASSTAVIAGTEMRLEATLAQSPKDKGFDLIGTIKVMPANGAFPPGTVVETFSLKPSWQGWPGYYPMNFVKRDGNWVLLGVHGDDVNFSATSKPNSHHHVIDFTWRNQGRGLGTKPEHFAAYDVGITISDATGKRFLLSQLGVPTK